MASGSLHGLSLTYVGAGLDSRARGVRTAAFGAELST